MKIWMRTLASVIGLILLAAPIANADDYARTNAWQFNNFKDPTLHWDVYRDTFVGIPPTYHESSGFAVLFYHEVYKDKLAKEGNCYGMALLSLMMLKNGGHLGYCAPIHQYSGDIFSSGGPTDMRLRRAINIMHGHQVNLPTLQYNLDIIAQNANRNGSFAYERFVTLRKQQDLALVSITRTLNPGDAGHTMVAYRPQDFGGDKRGIYVYDPSRTWADPAWRTWYQTGGPLDAGQNFIEINGNSWRFTKADGEIWSGDPASGGNLVIIPISVTGPHSRTPASLGLQIIGKLLTTLWISGQSARVEQVTDAHGKRLFKPGTYEVDTDPTTGMMNMVPWYPSDQANSGTQGNIVFLQFGSSGGALKVRVTSSDSGYVLRAMGARSQVSVTAHGGRGTDILTLHYPGSSDARIGLENGRGTSEYDVEFIQATRPRERLHVLTSNRMRIPEGAAVEVAVTDQDRALAVISPQATVHYDVELKTVTRDGEQSLQKSRVVHTPGTMQRVQPRNWFDLQKTDVLELVRPVRQ